jgi:hypothetical protein
MIEGMLIDDSGGQAPSGFDVKKDRVKDDTFAVAGSGIAGRHREPPSV